MTRYTEWLKEKLICKTCNRIISRGHIQNHLKSKIHKKNLEKNENEWEKTDEKDENDANAPKDKYTIYWD